jgi:tryptophan-rich sensory protein
MNELVAGAIDRKRAALAAVVLVPLLLGVGGLIASASGSIDDNLWYQSLALPVLQPPGPVFGIAWSLLYTLLALSAALVVGVRGGPVDGGPADGGPMSSGAISGRLKRQALALFAVGMVINWTWSPVFFLGHQIEAALAIIVVMLVLAMMTLLAFARLSRLAAWLMVPYIAWLMFAAGLNAAIWQMNPVADVAQIGV